MALVSVIIPVFNGASTIARAIDSALGQSLAHELEVVVVDDGSSDGTQTILSRYRARIQVISQCHRGPAVARNIGVAHSHGAYLAFLDADDSFLPDKLAHAVPALASDSEAVLLFHDAVAVSRQGEELGGYVPSESAHSPSMGEMLSRWWPIVPSTTILRRKIFEQCGGFYPEFTSAGYEDPHLWIRAREYGAFIYLPERLAYYSTDGPAERAEKYLRSQELFIRLIRQRYGAAAERLIRSTRLAYTSAVGHQGMLAMSAGDVTTARRCFKRAIRQRPSDLKSAARLLRTFLPARLAQRAKSRTMRRSRSAS